MGCFFWIDEQCQYQIMLEKSTKTCPFLKEGDCTAKTPEDFAKVQEKYNQEISQ